MGVLRGSVCWTDRRDVIRAAKILGDSLVIKRPGRENFNIIRRGRPDLLKGATLVWGRPC